MRQWVALLGKEHVHFRMSDAAAMIAGLPAARLWAADLSKGRGGSQPKLYLVATPSDFAAAYLRVVHKHAYEVIDDDRGCFLFFDLDRKIAPGEYELADAACHQLCTAAAAVLSEVAGQHHLPNTSLLEIDTLVLDGTRPCNLLGCGKFSRHVICRTSHAGAPWLLRGPCEAGAVARLVHQRLIVSDRAHVLLIQKTREYSLPRRSLECYTKIAKLPSHSETSRDATPPIALALAMPALCEPLAGSRPPA